MRKAVIGIEAELQERLAYFEKEVKLLEAQRLRMRTQYDLEMMSEVGAVMRLDSLVSSSFQTVDMDMESLPTGMVMPRSGQSSMPTARTAA